MSEITKSLSEALRQIRNHISFDTEIFSFPDKDIGCSLSLAEITGSKNTGEYLAVSVNISCECQVSKSLDNSDLKVVELAASVFAECENQTFNCTGQTAKNMVAVPLGDKDRFSSWVVNWDQEFYVTKLDLT